MLSLTSTTDQDWGRRAVQHIDEILLEQAHLEMKAAAAALRYMFKHQDRPSWQAPLSALAREELEHFGLVLAQLERRGVAFGPQHASPYAGELTREMRDPERERLLDSLLCSALIEARSCERMQLLGQALVEHDRELAALYTDLVASEARHHGLYLRLARDEFLPDEVSARLAELAAHEAAVVARIAPLPRLHG